MVKENIMIEKRGSGLRIIVGKLGYIYEVNFVDEIEFFLKFYVVRIGIEKFYLGNFRYCLGNL